MLFLADAPPPADASTWQIIMTVLLTILGERGFKIRRYVFDLWDKFVNVYTVLKELPPTLRAVVDGLREVANSPDWDAARKRVEKLGTEVVLPYLAKVDATLADNRPPEKKP